MLDGDSRHWRFCPSPPREFRPDPGIRLAEPFHEWHPRFPPEKLAKPRRIAAPAPHPLRLVQIVDFLQMLSSDRADQVHEPIGGHDLIGPQVDRIIVP